MIDVQTLSISLVTVGVLLLLSSFVHAPYLCKNSGAHCLGWRVLFGINALFVTGYGAFLWILLHQTATPAHMLVSAIFGGGGFFVALVVRMSRITVRDIQAVADFNRHHALHDDLTGLPNRTLLLERIRFAIAQARRNSSSCAVVLMDLDRFKAVNDTLGHAKGDYLLAQLAGRLRRCVRESDTIGRLGGDEFVAVLFGADVDDAIKVADKLASVIKRPFYIDKQRLNVGVSSGIAFYPEHGQDAETLLQRADVAMYRAKRAHLERALYETTGPRVDEGWIRAVER